MRRCFFRKSTALTRTYLKIDSFHYWVCLRHSREQTVSQLHITTGFEELLTLNSPFVIFLGNLLPLFYPKQRLSHTINIVYSSIFSSNYPSAAIIPDIPSIVIILDMLKQVDNNAISAFTPLRPLNKNAPAFKFPLICPNGNSTFSFRFL